MERIGFAIGDALPAKRRAVAAHRSQCGALIHDDPTAFSLSEQTIERLAGPSKPTGAPCDEGDRSRRLRGEIPGVGRSVGLSDLALRGGEARRADPRLRAGKLGRGLEIACAIGETSRSLATRCLTLVATDGAPTALATARALTPGRARIDFRHAVLPAGCRRGRSTSSWCRRSPTTCRRAISTAWRVASRMRWRRAGGSSSSTTSSPSTTRRSRRRSRKTGYAAVWRGA